MTRIVPIACVLVLIAAGGAVAQPQQQQREQQAQPAQPQAAPAGDAAQEALIEPADPTRPAPRSAAATEAELIRLRQQLQSAVEQAGVQSPEQRKALADRLDAIAARSAELAESLDQPAQQLEARNLELNARNSLARQAQQSADEKETGYRVSQLRNAAWNTKRLTAPAASTLGDFWLLQADLFDINTTTPDVDARQRQVIERMARFLREQDQMTERDHRGRLGSLGQRRATRQQQGGADEQQTLKEQPPQAQARREAGEHASPASAETQAIARQTILRDVKLALLSLYDQQGQTAEAAALLDELSSASDNDPAFQRELSHWFGHVSLVGQRFEANLDLSANRDVRDFAGAETRQELARQANWSSRDQLGRVVLIHFFADWYAPSVQAFAPLRAFHAEHRDEGLSILSVRLPDPPAPKLAENQDAAPAGETGGAKAAGGAGDAGGLASQPDSASTDTGKAAGGAGPQASSPIPWPIYHEGPGQVSLRRMFSVRTLPRFVLIDREGTVVSIAGSLAVLDHAEALLESSEAPADPPRDDSEPREAKQQPAP